MVYWYIHNLTLHFAEFVMLMNVKMAGWVAPPLWKATIRYLAVEEDPQEVDQVAH